MPVNLESPREETTSMDRVLLSFTPSISKMLIAKGVAGLKIVQRAFKRGKMLLSTGTSTAYVYRELCGKMPEEALACGMVTEKGLCVGRGMTAYLGKHGYAKYWYFEQGNLIPSDDLEGVLQDFSAGDVFIKGANAIDGYGHAGILLGMENGGTMGKALGYVMAKGIHFIVPAGLEKVVVGSISEHAKEMGIDKLYRSSGMPVGLVPVSGTVLTEIEALRQLADVIVHHVASGGISGGEGSVTLLVKGEKKQLEKVVRLYSDLKQNDRLEQLESPPATCADHKWRPCIQKNLLYQANIKEGI
jgi:hypothetical protein